MSVFYNNNRFWNVKSLPSEKWVAIKEFNDMLWVSNMGRVKMISLSNRVGRLAGTPYIIPQSICGGYLTIGFYCNGKNHMKSVHRLVALHFIPNPNNKKTVNHKKGIKIDNRASQLEWATYSEQEMHSLRIGLRKTGSDHFAAKLSNQDILFIRNSSLKQTELAAMFNVSRPHINNIILNKRRKHEVSYT